MEKIVVDTSVAIKWFVDEPKSEEALVLLTKKHQKNVKIIVPDILRLEIINGLFYSYHFGTLQLKDTLNSLESLGLKYVNLDEIDLKIAVSLMEEFTLAAYDALFITLSQQLNCPLITNDKKHHLKKYYSKIKYL